jgi:hypothetical protein
VADFEIKAHDRLPSFRVQLMTDEDQPQIVDLTNAQSAKFIMTRTVGGAIVISAAAVIETPATLGILRYDWLAVDTAVPGEFLGEWEVTWVGGKKQTFPTGTYHSIAVLADLDGA